jgi:myo-inositol-1(or 4)-monophosphatase
VQRALIDQPEPVEQSAFDDDLAFALELAHRAGRILMDRYERVEQVNYKGARDVVTEVDRLSEDLIIAAIHGRHPGDAILAEESGDVGRPRDDVKIEVGRGVGRIWVIDPLDGTVNYANGIPIFCVSVALAVEGRPAVGVVHDPTRGETFAATSDGAATLDGQRVLASEKEGLTDYVVSMALGGRGATTRVRAVRKRIRVSRSMGSAALALAYVANGRFDAFIQSGGLSAWDIAAAGLIAERAGATVTDIAGGPWFDLARPHRGAGILAAPAAHHATLLSLIREAPSS